MRNNNDTSLSNSSADNDKNKNKNKDIKDTRRKYTRWHFGYIGAMDIELRKAGCQFTFISEYQTVSNSRYIDMLIDRKPSSNNSKLSGIAGCLRNHTFCEFKSPDDTLTIYDIDRLIHLGLQYYLDLNDQNEENKKRNKRNNKNENNENNENNEIDEINDISRDEVAGLFIVSHFPREALKLLPNGWGIENIEPGIYIITNANFLVSIVVIKELDDQTYKLLTSLQSELDKDRLENLINESQQYGYDSSWSQYLQLLFELNIEKGEIKMSPTLLEKIKQTPYGAEMLNLSRAEGKAEGRTEGRAEGETGGKAEAIIRILTRRLDRPSAKLQEQISEVKNVQKLDELIDFAVTCVSLGEFATAFN
ncbi:MAG: hypothetical protein LBE18_06175 [Planctomycetaceae bacterium]|jgi:hypothetical protein|nr:hypothetical protein [Planctomycetaceae bacterium]